MSAPWETVTVPCLQCRKKIKVPAGRRRRAIRLNLPWADFCSAQCCKMYVGINGTQSQNKPKEEE